ncbi:MAG TPA: response regulator transcription factor [Candidatus Acidoferrum sp.]|nr:response regulator transcription factor [Candidatus Acidoferrum sp.]
MTRILLIEDNRDLAYGLRNNLEIEGYDVEVAHDGVAGLRMFSNVNPDLTILDIMLPHLDGFRVLKTLREKDRATPVLLLSAKGEEFDKVRGLRLGADDYVTKPFSLLELLARVEALLRRTQPPLALANNAHEVHRFGNVEVDAAACTVRRASESVELAPKEFSLLLALLRAGGAVVSRLQLMREVWGYSAAIVSRTVDTHIAELRRKLEENPASPRHIITVRKTGYRIKP